MLKISEFYIDETILEYRTLHDYDRFKVEWMYRWDLNHGQHERQIFSWEDKKNYFVTCVTAHSLNLVSPELRTNTKVQES